MTVTVYGDSIFKGVLLEGGRYVVNRFWEMQLADRFHLTIENFARFGCTIQKILPVIRRNCREGRLKGEIAVLELGGNDCDYDWARISENPDEEYDCKTPPQVFMEQYREAIRLIRSSGGTPMLMTLPPVHSERYLGYICRNGLSRQNILHWLGDVNAIYRWQDKYSEMVEQLAAEEKTKLIDLRKAFPKDADSLEPYLCIDGIHPSRLGQKLIYDTLCSRLSVFESVPSYA